MQNTVQRQKKSLGWTGRVESSQTSTNHHAPLPLHSMQCSTVYPQLDTLTTTLLLGLPHRLHRCGMSQLNLSTPARPKKEKGVSEERRGEERRGELAAFGSTGGVGGEIGVVQGGTGDPLFFCLLSLSLSFSASIVVRFRDRGSVIVVVVVYAW